MTDWTPLPLTLNMVRDYKQFLDTYHELDINLARVGPSSMVRPILAYLSHFREHHL